METKWAWPFGWIIIVKCFISVFCGKLRTLSGKRHERKEKFSTNKNINFKIHKFAHFRMKKKNIFFLLFFEFKAKPTDKKRSKVSLKSRRSHTHTQKQINCYVCALRASFMWQIAKSTANILFFIKFINSFEIFMKIYFLVSRLKTKKHNFFSSLCATDYNR